MVIANEIPRERRIACESKHIECLEISDTKFRKVAEECGYEFQSESNKESELVSGAILTTLPPTEWSYRGGKSSSADEQDFLSRCDETGKVFFAALFSSQKKCSTLTKITWEHESGFSLQFRFPKIGFAPLVWGFPSKNREGKAIKQRLGLPFDFASRKRVPQAFINEFGKALSSIIFLSGGDKRPSIAVETLNQSEREEIIDVIFSFANKASVYEAVNP